MGAGLSFTVMVTRCTSELSGDEEPEEGANTVLTRREFIYTAATSMLAHRSQKNQHTTHLQEKLKTFPKRMDLKQSRKEHCVFGLMEGAE